MLAVFDPTFQAILWTLALAAYAIGAIAAARQRTVTWITAGGIALGLALWHFPALWDIWGRV
jgi:hypothetical protein